MSEHRAAYRYAKALMDLAIEQNNVSAVEKDMRLVLDTIEQNESLTDVLRSPVLTGSDKNSALKALFKNSQPLTSELFNLLASNKRIGILKEVAQQYITLYDQMQGQEIATVVTAVPLNKDLEAKILKKLEEISGKEVTLENEIDADLIGGFILKVGDLEYNASVSGKLEKLERKLLST
ncbi:ATP synthase F1 subunit delta [Robiginitalea aurantiaca]|uniref:ATP synthase subunit delta n=1 Tax=Robiginitalea aurantiaca TaxID=3056915 RepID=A0ABT7WAI4_9FLAO|nr:ATP synthase F1 subunit delta [Robiginitalea aurantiaca]MDM9629929.1 ATP synthase F1 subunit delta [Robiginitalea aurantiaca]